MSTGIKPKDWQELTQLTRGEPIVVERVRLAAKDIAIEGSFELPQLARMGLEDQVFITAFVRCHGSIKEMEQIFGVSYPTIKNRLHRIGAQLPFVELAPEAQESPPPAMDLLARLERGELSVREVLDRLREKEPS